MAYLQNMPLIFKAWLALLAVLYAAQAVVRIYRNRRKGAQ